MARAEPSKVLQNTCTGIYRDSVADKQAIVRATYSRMVQQNTGKLIEVTVFKKDRLPLTREGQWTEPSGISKHLVEATMEECQMSKLLNPSLNWIL